MAITVTLPPIPHEEQQAFNLKRWEELCADPELAKIAGRIETDRHGHIIMTPPPGQDHGKRQYRIASLLEQLIGADQGVLLTECPISTSDGVKAADVAWISRARDEENRGQSCLTTCPEICVEILSPSNTPLEMEEKKALYLEAGAQEVWFCEEDGTMTLFSREGALECSVLCPDFPRRVELP